MTRFSILPYSSFSKSASCIINAAAQTEGMLNTRKTAFQGSRWLSFAGGSLIREPHVMVQWGNVTGVEGRLGANRLILNGTNNKTTYTNKLNFFNRFFGRPHLTLPWYTDNTGRAGEILRTTAATPDQIILVERHVLSGHSGEGIRLLTQGDAPDPRAKLWTSYVKKAEEYRVHFFKGIGKFIIQQKRLKRENFDRANETTFKVRNYQNGWVYCRDNVNPPAAVLAQAQYFMNSALNDLDFGAIDIIYNSRTNIAYILEVNLAPGAEGTTAKEYAEAFKEYADTHDFTTETGKYTRKVI